jgi:hypothetical protein
MPNSQPELAIKRDLAWKRYLDNKASAEDPDREKLLRYFKE